MRNTMTMGEFIKEHVVWSLLVFLWFRNFLFRCLPNCTYTESLVGFLVISACVMAVGIAISWHRNRNGINVIENILLSWGVFVGIAYLELCRDRIIYTLLVAAFISLILSLLILCRRIKKRDKRHKILARRFENIAVLWKRNSALAALVIVVPIGISSVLYGTVLNSKVDVVKLYGDEYSLKANIETIADIEPGRWEKLDIQSKLNVCQAIINVEARYYGLSRKITIGTADLSWGTWAYYRDTTHQIVIDMELLEDAYSYDVLKTLLHEVHHAYQYELVELYQKMDEQERSLRLFYEASIFMEEFADYEDGDEDFYAYYTQLTECYAREAGETESLVYIEAVNDYLGIELDVDMDEFSCLQEYVNYISQE